MKRDYFSASSGTRFVECIANWATNYDEDRKINTRNDYSDVGNLVHGALEEWRNPENGHPQTFEALEACFERAATKYVFAEPLDAYKRAKDLLAASFRMTQNHPTVPMNLLETIATEQAMVNMDGSDWQMEGWVQPVRGMLDHLGIIPLPGSTKNEIVVFLEDYKTGRPKSHDDLTESDIQPPLYFLWVRDVLVPCLEEQGYNVKRIIGSWTYVGDGSAVPLYESDFDHETTQKYVANLQAQMKEFERKYNEFMATLDAQYGEPPTDPVTFTTWEDEREAEINKWLADYERPNPYCMYCPRKGVCQTFQRMLRYDGKVDLTGPNINFDTIAEELQAYQLIEKNAKSRVDEIKSLIPIYLDQERLEAIPLTDGREFVANGQTRKRYNVQGVIEVMGTDFVLQNAQVTDTAIKRELDLISRTDADKARTLEAQLAATYTTVPGPRPVIIRKVQAPKKARGSK